MGQEIYQKISTHLDESVTNFIDVMSLETEKFIARKLSIDKIKTNHGSLDNYFQSLVKKGIEKVQVTLRKKRGSSSVPVGAGLNIGLGNSAPTVPTPTPDLPPSHQMPLPAPRTAPSGSLSSEILRFKNDTLNEKLADIKILLSEEKLKRKAQAKKIEKLDTKNRDLKAKVHLYDREKALEIQELEKSQKGFLDSDAGKELLQTGLSIAASLASGNANTTPGLASASENDNLSDAKKALIQFVENEMVLDEHCAAVYYALVGLVEKNEIFSKKLHELLEKHKLQNQGNENNN